MVETLSAVAVSDLQHKAGNYLSQPHCQYGKFFFFGKVTARLANVEALQRLFNISNELRTSIGYCVEK